MPSKSKTDSKQPIDTNLKATDVKTQSPVELKDRMNLKTSTNNIHNHMNTNVFVNQDNFKSVIPSQSQILVEIDGKRPISYNPSPMIFTTAKIHTDSKTNKMEPVQVTPVPILSTLEGSGSKSGVTTSVNKSNILSTVPEIRSLEKLHKNGVLISVTNIKTETKGNNITSNSQIVSSSRIASTEVTETNSDEVKISSGKDPISVSSVIKTISGPINKPEQSNLSYSSISIESIKNKLPTHTSRQQCNLTDNMPQNSLASKLGDSKSINREIPKVQESQIDSNKCLKNSSSIDSNKAMKQKDIDNTEFSKVRDSTNNTDKDKLNKLTTNRQLQRQKKADESDCKSHTSTKDIQFTNNSGKTSKDNSQSAFSSIEQPSYNIDSKITQHNDKPKPITSDMNSSEVSKTLSKSLKTSHQLPLNSLLTKQSNNTGSTVTCASSLTQFSSEPVTAAGSILSKPRTSDGAENIKVKTLTSSSKSKTENADISNLSLISVHKPVDSKVLSKTTSTAAPVSLSNNSSTSASSMTNTLTTIRGLPKTTKASSSTAVTRNGTSVATTITVSQNKNNGQKSVDNNDKNKLKGWKA